MQQRRFRPGDVLDDYCPRERRITDHAIVAMIEDHIKQTRCVVCDAEHAYKQGKVPPQRRKRAQAALFTQVLDGLQGPQRTARLNHHPDTEPEHDLMPDGSDVAVAAPAAVQAQSGNGHDDLVHAAPTNSTPQEIIPDVPLPAPDAQAASLDAHQEGPAIRDEGPVRRPLIRATLPRPEGQPIASRAMPEFTIRQPNSGRSQRPGGRRRGGHQQQGQGAPGPMRFGRGGQGQGQRQHGGRHGGSRRGGKKR